jgi:hypothetical protein
MRLISRRQKSGNVGWGTSMKGKCRIAAVALALLALGYAPRMSQRTGHAMEPVATGVAGSVVESSAADMTARKEIARMALAGNAHAEHAMMDAVAPPLQAAPPNSKLPADENGAKERLSATKRRSWS